MTLKTPQPSERSLSFIGTGNMGMGMLRRWMNQGGCAFFCDIDPTRQAQGNAAGAEWRHSPAELAQGLPANGLLVITVVTADETRTVLWGEGGAAQHLVPGQCVMLCPTIAPEDTVAIAQRLQDIGVSCIDAPMSGGPVRAEQGSMSLMVACTVPDFERHQETLQTLANPVFHVSERVGDGARTKLVNNLLAGIQLVGAAEVLVLAERMGLNLSTTLAVIEQSSGQSWIGSNRMHRALRGTTDIQAHMSLLAKDTGLAMQAAEHSGYQPLLGQQAAATFAAALDAGWADRDDSAMLDWLRRHGIR